MADQSQVFELTATRTGDALAVKLRGAIDEKVQSALTPHLTAEVRRCVFDMLDVTGINSWGSQKLLAVLKARPEIAFSITACPWSFIDQINLILDMRRAFHVDSVQYPLQCPACSHWSTALLQRAEFARVAEALRSKTCVKCGTVCDLAVDPAEFLYFYFEGEAG